MDLGWFLVLGFAMALQLLVPKVSDRRTASDADRDRGREPRYGQFAPEDVEDASEALSTRLDGGNEWEERGPESERERETVSPESDLQRVVVRN